MQQHKHFGVCFRLKNFYLDIFGFCKELFQQRVKDFTIKVYNIEVFLSYIFITPM